MLQVPSYEAFQALEKRVEAVERENGFLKELLTGKRWLNRNQAMIALGVKDGKLRQLTVNRIIAHRYEGTKPYYDVISIRAYLEGRKIEGSEIDKRVLRAYFE
ncbi:hypothetical protein [Spirosoma gilvum]